MKYVLILEDDLETLSVIFKVLFETKVDFIPVVLSTYEQVENLLNPCNLEFDLILLDRDCALGGSFHALDFNKFGVDKIVGISSIPEYNKELLKRGVKTIIDKKYRDLSGFAVKLKEEIISREFKNRFQKMSNQQLLDTYNEDITKLGWVSAREPFYFALREEFKNRGLTYPSV